MDVPTDLDYLIKLGYPKYLAKCCLIATKGDRKAAILLLKKDGKISTNDKAWRGETDEDWINYIATSELPKTVESRALWKSPIYVRIGSFIKVYSSDDKVRDAKFQISVVLKDKRSWMIGRLYSEFRSFYYSLPLGSFNILNNRFPLPSFFQYTSDAFFEQRRENLEVWMQELVFNEEFMSNPIVLSKLYSFLDADAHGGAVSATNPLSLRAADAIPFNVHYSVGAHTRNWPMLNFKYSPLPSGGSPPLPLETLQASLPCKAQLFDLLDPSLLPTGGGKDSSDAQLTKDFSRDRIVLQGRRLLGSQTPLPRFLNLLHSALQAVLLSSPQGEHFQLQHFDFENVDPDIAIWRTLNGDDHQTSLDSPHKHKTTTTSINTKTSTSEAESSSTPTTPSSPTSSPTSTTSTSPQHSSSEQSYLQHTAFEAFLKNILRSVSRTESAFLSHSALMNLIDLSTPVSPPPPPPPPLPTTTTTTTTTTTSTTSISTISSNPSTSSSSSHVPSQTSSTHLNSLRSLFNRSQTQHTSENDATEGEDLEEEEEEEDDLGAFEMGPLLVIPESILAEPIEIAFSIKERDPPPTSSSSSSSTGSGSGGASEWCVVVECLAVTVFRVVHSMSMQTLLQLRVTYRSVCFGMPVYLPAPTTTPLVGIGPSSHALTTSSSYFPPQLTTTSPHQPNASPLTYVSNSIPCSPHRKVVGFELKKGKTYLCLDRETKTTARDLK